MCGGGVTDGAVQQWVYNTDNVGDLIVAATGQVPATPLTVGTVKFRLSLLPTITFYLHCWNGKFGIKHQNSEFWV
jgi:hypothetical protein